MIHPYASRTRNRDRRLAQPTTSSSGAVSWIVATGFTFILLIGFVLPVLHHFAGAAR